MKNKNLIIQSILNDRYFYIAIILSFFALLFLWENSLTKGIMIILSFIILFEKNKLSITSIYISLFIVSIYFINHWYYGSYDIKAFFVVIQFLFLSKIVSLSRNKYDFGVSRVVYLIVIMILANILLVQQSFRWNIFSAEFERYRGLFLTPLFLMASTMLNIRNWKRVLIAIIIGLIAYTASGTRNDAALLLLGISSMSVNPRLYPFFIPLSFLTVIFSPLIYFFGGNDIFFLNNVVVRALTEIQIFKNLSLFGAGITPPLKVFFSKNIFEHYFVPADAFFLGYIYELGLVSYLIKILFACYVVKKNKYIRNKALFWVGVSYFLFGYCLTFELFVLVFSVFAVSCFEKINNKYYKMI